MRRCSTTKDMSRPSTVNFCQCDENSDYSVSSYVTKSITVSFIALIVQLRT